ncbi:hypothetical protein HYH03_000488 [Edaphochlamys debaryana]|uniref:Uncharacterized protein n=1 Tax=Edaphochlamys debaryana TaxID=47281 RepID=A0A835YFK5_9CHLO|nr:hypothetical protein HYH03_000488 [Edaphochlamys debaryana]|eukprot:KAG2501992.1 hypothetical protein HYH03_000488 [Edaphochlamys debaryana]
MGSGESKPSNPILARIEQEAVRAAVPRGLKDERSRQLEYDLNWCYNRNNWYFTAGGILIGVTLGVTMKSVQPLAWAAILAPAGDWLYEQHACRDLTEAYEAHQRALKGDAREKAEAARAGVREHFEALMAGQAAAGEGAAGQGAGQGAAGVGVGAGAGAVGGAGGAPAGPGQGGAAAAGAGAPAAGAGGARRSWWPWGGGGGGKAT